MKSTKVYASGCKRCKAAAAKLRGVATRFGVEADVIKVSDPKPIAMTGVFA